MVFTSLFIDWFRSVFTKTNRFNRHFYATISPENIEQTGIMNLKFIVTNIKDMTFIVALFCIAKFAKDFMYVEKLKNVLKSQTKEAQRKLFQAQFDPHFMFNTINNLYALSILNPKKTSEVISRIKIILKYIVEEIQKELVDLHDEVLLVKNIISLEQLRYGNRLKVDFKVEGNLENIKIPPMILFYLAENCFKHGSSLDAGSPWIRISVITRHNSIKIISENSLPENMPDNNKIAYSPKGLKNLEKRLEIIYSKNGFALKTEKRENSYKVDLEIKEEIENRTNKYR